MYTRVWYVYFRSLGFKVLRKNSNQSKESSLHKIKANEFAHKLTTPSMG